MRERPVFERLPVRNYQDNPVVDSLLSYFDEKLVSTGTQAQDLYLKLNPVTCPPEYLDWLAFMVGMIPPQYDYKWTDSVKRLAVAKANDIFMMRGTADGIKKALDIHGFEYYLYTSDDIKLPFTFNGISNKFGKKNSTAYILMPIKYPRNGYEYREANRVVDNYSAMMTPLRTCYDKFYLDFSVFDDVIF